MTERPLRKNIFSIGRSRRLGPEDQLSEMFAWLAETVPAVTGAVADLAFPGEHVKAADIRVGTQRTIALEPVAQGGLAQDGALDLILEGPDLIVVIESKLDSPYGSGQIEKYLRWLQQAHRSTTRKALITLTKRPAPWSEQDRQLAARIGVRAVERRWAETHVLLSELVTRQAMHHPFEADVIRQFLEMLSAEGIEPVRPLDRDELGGAWADGHTPRGRFKEYFSECKLEIADLLGVVQHENRWSEKDDVPYRPYQEFNLPDGMWCVIVGLSMSDGGESRDTSPAPSAWVAVEADPIGGVSPDALAAMGWRAGGIWDRDRHQVASVSWRAASHGQFPRVWRPLAEIATGPTFEEQRLGIAHSCAEAAKILGGRPE